VLLRSGQDGTERVLIADLGLAKAAARGSGFTLTVGTPGYTAPEQARPGDTPLDRRADVYSIGAVLHHLLTGVPPKQDEAPVPVRSLRPELPAAVEAVVRQALAPLPGDRYPSAGALADALDAAAVRVRETPASSLMPYQPPDREDNERILRLAPDRVDDTLTIVRPRGPRRRGRLLTVLVAVLVLAGGGIAAAVVVRGRQVRITTADGSVHLRVPAAWAGQERLSPWDLGPYRVTGRTGTAVAVAPDLVRWEDPASTVPGVFAGRADGVEPRDLLARSFAAGCPAGPSQPVSGSGLSGTLTRKTCPGSPMAYVEAVLQPPDATFSVYVQVKVPVSAGTADDVIRSLVVNWS